MLWSLMLQAMIYVFNCAAKYEIWSVFLDIKRSEYFAAVIEVVVQVCFISHIHAENLLKIPHEWRKIIVFLPGNFIFSGQFYSAVLFYV